MLFFDRDAVGDKFCLTMVALDGTLFVPGSAGDVTVRRSIDGGAWGAATGTLSITAGELIFTMSVADKAGKTTAFKFTAAGAVPEDRSIQTYDVLREAVWRGKINRRSQVSLAAADLEYADAAAAAWLAMYGVGTPDNLSNADPVIDLTFPGVATVIYQFDAHTPVGDYLTDRGFTRFRAMIPTARTVTAITTPNMDDCLVSAFVLASANETKVGTAYTRKLPNNTGNFVVFALDSATTPTTRTR